MNNLVEIDDAAVGADVLDKSSLSWIQSALVSEFDVQDFLVNFAYGGQNSVGPYFAHARHSLCAFLAEADNLYLLTVEQENGVAQPSG